MATLAWYKVVCVFLAIICLCTKSFFAIGSAVTE